MRSLAAMLLAVTTLGTVAFASRIIQMSFEEAARTSGVVVLGKVMQSEEFGTVRKYSTGTTLVVRTHRVHVDEYLKGDGPSEIVVETLGGKYVREIDGKPTELVSIAGGQPQLPDDGTAVMLFLTPFGGNDTFVISSASAGVVAIETDTEGQEFVRLGFEDPDVMPPGAREAYNQGNSESSSQYFGASVPLKDLRSLVQRAINPKPKPTEPQTKPSP